MVSFRHVSELAGAAARAAAIGPAGTSLYDGGITATLLNTAAGNGPLVGPAHQARPALPKRL